MLRVLVCLGGWSAALLLGVFLCGTVGCTRLEAGLEALAVAEEFTDSSLPVTKLPKAASDALAAGASETPRVQLHRSLQMSWRERPGFPLNAQAVQRALRARQEALCAALACRFQHPLAAVALGHHADRPTLRTQSLRGPPAFG
ncbi:hypothetical protein [Stigmatella erecta]|uniref:Uncharacterized protein n=1 Tax=Stigmatella erecta TaxID=83460 RepID=A0A1I0I5I7_9BACT|nr:hypothetical protein [Stigmatella erecta]SET91856.1 hypothetical protein SAMN05443639_105314 [Stigmatella erecta]